MRDLIHIFLAFLRVGLLGYGGGPSSIPLVHREVVEKYRWMDDDEFSDVLALGNTLPGPITTKMAGYIGYRVKGITGCVVGVLAMALPTVFLMIGLLGLLLSYKDSPRVHGMTAAVRPVVGVMLGVLAYGFFKKAWKDSGMFSTISIAAVSLLLIGLGVHPAVVMGVILIVAVIKGLFERDSGQKGERT
ncbi:MAG: chromate transporter [Bacillaceae bacterium]|nr:chromate transporter [Bacillaceae bacterium]